MRRLLCIVPCVLPCTLLLCIARASYSSDATPNTALSTAQAELLFAAKVLPLFKQKCFGCHGDDPDQLKGGFDMRSRIGLLQGGESEEPALVPGKPEEEYDARAMQSKSVKGGVSVGRTDELGSAAVEDRLHVKHLHATILNQLGLDPNRLAYFYNGLDQKLVGVEDAEPIQQII